MNTKIWGVYLFAFLKKKKLVYPHSRNFLLIGMIQLNEEVFWDEEIDQLFG